MSEIDQTPLEMAVAVKEPAPTLAPAGQEAVEKPKAADAEAVRNEAVASLIATSMANATQLRLTEAEQAALTAEFPDEDFELGAAGDPSLIYLSHDKLRQRLARVLGLGQANFIRRRVWAEEYRTREGRKAVRIYFDGALIVRGVLVGEGIGDHSYFPDNAKQTYSDCLEAAKSNAYRRACKDFCVGLQAWDKVWIEGWKRRHPDKVAAAYAKARQNPLPGSLDAQIIAEWRLHTSSTMPAQPSAPTPTHAVKSDEEKRQRWIRLCREAAGGADWPAEEVLTAEGMLPEFTKLGDMPVSAVPATKKQADAILAKIRSTVPKETAPDAGQAEGKTEIVGVVGNITTKEVANGGTLYRIGVVEDGGSGAETWIATFDDTDGQQLLTLRGKHVKLQVTQDKFGLKLVKHAIGLK